MSLTVIADDQLADGLRRIQREVDAVFDALLPLPGDSRAALIEAMRYAAIGGGKRVRPLLVAATAEMYGVDRDAAVRAGARRLEAAIRTQGLVAVPFAEADAFANINRPDDLAALVRLLTRP